MTEAQDPGARLRAAWEEIWHACEAADEEELLEALTAVEVLWTLGALTPALQLLREMIALLQSRCPAN